MAARKRRKPAEWRRILKASSLTYELVQGNTLHAKLYKQFARWYFDAWVWGFGEQLLKARTTDAAKKEVLDRIEKDLRAELAEIERLKEEVG